MGKENALQLDERYLVIALMNYNDGFVEKTKNEEVVKTTLFKTYIHF